MTCIVFARVARLSPVFDTFEHLIMKAFLLTEKGKGGSEENRYSSLYVWPSEQVMMDFLSGERFKGATQAFGWPPVQTWTVINAHWGERTRSPIFATRELIQVAPHTDLQALRDSERVLQQQTLQEAGMHSRIVALDASTWTLLRFTLWETSLEVTTSSFTHRCYEVAHLSTPMIDVVGV